VSVDPADPDAREAVSLDERDNLLMLDEGRSRQGLQETQDLGACRDAAASELPNHKLVTDDLSTLEGACKLPVAPAEMIDPDARVNQDHEAARDRRRRIGPNLRSVPPSAASRRALSRAISASSPAWRRAVFSRIPLRRAARVRSSSFRLSVVLICISMHYWHRSASRRELRRGRKGL